jgi:hypothetical protein
VREAVARAAAAGTALRLVSMRLLAPLKPEVLDQALAGVRQVLVVEQNHGGQLLRYLRSRCDLPGRPAACTAPARCRCARATWRAPSSTGPRRHATTAPECRRMNDMTASS